MKERKLRIEDALAATRAAVEEGIVPGGGTALLRTIARRDRAVQEGYRRPEAPVSTSCCALWKSLSVRSRPTPVVEGSVIVEKIKARKACQLRLRCAANDEYGDMAAKGIIDPTKVTRSALQNAASIASMLLTTESLVCDLPEKNPAPAAPAQPPMY